MSKTDARKPDARKTGVSQAGAGKPDAGKPDAGKTDAGKPDARKTGVSQAGAGKPDAGKTDAGKTDAGKPDARKTGVSQAGAGKADASQADAGKTAHPRHQLDEVIHAPVRLSVMAALASADRITFGFLRDTVEVSDSLLSKHITILEGAGYIEVVKGYEGKRPRTWFSLTDDGRAAFKRYKETLRRLIDGDRL